MGDGGVQRLPGQLEPTLAVEVVDPRAHAEPLCGARRPAVTSSAMRIATRSNPASRI
jgi:hypothetical protein